MRYLSTIGEPAARPLGSIIEGSSFSGFGEDEKSVNVTLQMWGREGKP
jgi:hypothetical protein